MALSSSIACSKSVRLPRPEFLFFSLDVRAFEIGPQPFGWSCCLGSYGSHGYKYFGLAAGGDPVRSHGAMGCPALLFPKVSKHIEHENNCQPIQCQKDGHSNSLLPRLNTTEALVQMNYALPTIRKS